MRDALRAAGRPILFSICEWGSNKPWEWAQEVGLITGNGTEIDGEPNCMWEDVLTREQFATVLYRFAKIIGKA